MNREELYRAIGELDDELIQEAAQLEEAQDGVQQGHENAARTEKKRTVIRLWQGIAAAAACICLIGTFLFYQNAGVSRIYWNESQGPVMMKQMVPADSTERRLSLAEVEEYYQMETLSETLGDNLQRADPLFCAIYENAGGTVVYDQNQIWYQNQETGQYVCLTLSRVTKGDPDTQSARISQISGQNVCLEKTDAGAEIPIYTAKWEQNGTTVLITEGGLDETQFLDVVELLIGN